MDDKFKSHLQEVSEQIFLCSSKSKSVWDKILYDVRYTSEGDSITVVRLFLNDKVVDKSIAEPWETNDILDEMWDMKAETESYKNWYGIQWWIAKDGSFETILNDDENCISNPNIY